MTNCSSYKARVELLLLLKTLLNTRPIFMQNFGKKNYLAKPGKEHEARSRGEIVGQADYGGGGGG